MAVDDFVFCYAEFNDIAKTIAESPARDSGIN
jgi:hypothetical protein